MVYSSSVWGSKTLYPMGLWETVVSGRKGGGMAEQGVQGGKRSLWALIILHGMVSSNLSPKAMLCLLLMLLRKTTRGFSLYNQNKTCLGLFWKFQGYQFDKDWLWSVNSEQSTRDLLSVPFTLLSYYVNQSFLKYW